MYKQKFNLKNLVNGVVALNKPAAYSKHIKMNLSIEDDVPTHIIADEFRLNRILINLIGNAVKFTNVGDISMRLAVSMTAESRNGILIFDIKDTGIGIPSHKISSVFQKFVRGVESNKNEYHGTGLGLYVVKKFTADLDGDVEVESVEGEGTSFRITIPFKVPLLKEA